MLYLIGLGLHDELDISLKGLYALKKCSRAYAEFYTNPFSGSLENLVSISGKDITPLSRKDLEECPQDNVLRGAEKEDIALLVSGDPMVATTHIDLVLRARKLGIRCRIIHSSSIYSAVAETGLQIYKFGRTGSIPYPEGDYFPTSAYDLLAENRKAGMHTLLLLDVKADIGRYMTVAEGIEILLETEEKKKACVFTKESLCIGLARIGSEDSVIYAGKASELLGRDFGKQPHCLIIPGKMHFIEEEAVSLLR